MLRLGSQFSADSLSSLSGATGCYVSLLMIGLAGASVPAMAITPGGTYPDGVRYEGRVTATANGLFSGFRLSPDGWDYSFDGADTDYLDRVHYHRLPDTNISSRNSSAEGLCAGNPVVIGTGNKIEHEIDFESTNQLGLRRTYNHYIDLHTIFGKKWISNFDYSVSFQNYESGACTVDSWGIQNCDKLRAHRILANRPDGRRIAYVRGADGRFTSSDAPSNTYMYWDGSVLVYKAENLSTETYARDGFDASYISTRANELGETWTYEGMLWMLSKVTHSSGRYTEFFWDGNLRLVSVKNPEGNYHGYGYKELPQQSGFILASHTQSASNISQTYHYENPAFTMALTGKSYGGVRYSTFSYTVDGKVASTEHAGGVDRYEFSYGDNYDPECEGWCEPTEWYTSIKNPLGRYEAYVFDGGGKADWNRRYRVSLLPGYSDCY